MQRKRHTPEQIVAKLRDADGLLAAGQTVEQVPFEFDGEVKVVRFRRSRGMMAAWRLNRNSRPCCVCCWP